MTKLSKRKWINIFAAMGVIVVVLVILFYGKGVQFKGSFNDSQNDACGFKEAFYPCMVEKNANGQFVEKFNGNEACAAIGMECDYVETKFSDYEWTVVSGKNNCEFYEFSNINVMARAKCSESKCKNEKTDKICLTDNDEVLYQDGETACKIDSTKECSGIESSEDGGTWTLMETPKLCDNALETYDDTQYRAICEEPKCVDEDNFNNENDKVCITNNIKVIHNSGDEACKNMSTNSKCVGIEIASGQKGEWVSYLNGDLSLCADKKNELKKETYFEPKEKGIMKRAVCDSGISCEAGSKNHMCITKEKNKSGNEACEVIGKWCTGVESQISPGSGWYAWTSEEFACNKNIEDYYEDNSEDSFLYRAACSEEKFDWVKLKKGSFLTTYESGDNACGGKCKSIQYFNTKISKWEIENKLNCNSKIEKNNKDMGWEWDYIRAVCDSGVSCETYSDCFNHTQCNGKKNSEEKTCVWSTVDGKEDPQMGALMRGFCGKEDCVIAGICIKPNTVISTTQKMYCEGNGNFVECNEKNDKSGKMILDGKWFCDGKKWRECKQVGETDKDKKLVCDGEVWKDCQGVDKEDEICKAPEEQQQEQQEEQEEQEEQEQKAETEICNDKKDNDLDKEMDCFDSECVEHQSCQPVKFSYVGASNSGEKLFILMEGLGYLEKGKIYANLSENEKAKLKISADKIETSGVFEAFKGEISSIDFEKAGFLFETDYKKIISLMDGAREVKTLGYAKQDFMDLEKTNMEFFDSRIKEILSAEGKKLKKLIGIIDQGFVSSADAEKKWNFIKSFYLVREMGLLDNPGKIQSFTAEIENIFLAVLQEFIDLKAISQCVEPYKKVETKNETGGFICVNCGNLKLSLGELYEKIKSAKSTQEMENAKIAFEDGWNNVTADHKTVCLSNSEVALYGTYENEKYLMSPEEKCDQIKEQIGILKSLIDAYEYISVKDIVEDTYSVKEKTDILPTIGDTANFCVLDEKLQGYGYLPYSCSEYVSELDSYATQLKMPGTAYKDEIKSEMEKLVEMYKYEKNNKNKICADLDIKKYETYYIPKTCGEFESDFENISAQMDKILNGKEQNEDPKSKYENLQKEIKSLWEEYEDTFPSGKCAFKKNYEIYETKEYKDYEESLNKLYQEKLVVLEKSVNEAKTGIEFASQQKTLKEIVTACKALKKCVVDNKYQILLDKTWVEPVDCTGKYANKFSSYKISIENAKTQNWIDAYVAGLKPVIDEAKTDNCNVPSEIETLLTFKVAEIVDCSSNEKEYLEILALIKSAQTAAIAEAYKVALEGKIKKSKEAGCQTPIYLMGMVAGQSQVMQSPQAQSPQAIVGGFAGTQQLQQLQQQPFPVENSIAGQPHSSAPQIQAVHLMGLSQTQPMAQIPQGAVRYATIPAETGPGTHVLISILIGTVLLMFIWSKEYSN